MSVGMVGFVTDVVVSVVGVAMVGAGSMVSCVSDVGRRHGSGGGGVRGLKVKRERERELRDCNSSEKKRKREKIKGKNNILIWLRNIKLLLFLALSYSAHL